ncbi:hypothetical protein VP01_1609g10 [Puccinia sorghi]|uniref:Uncharacterized protein n=1 Tax=Puccinia sorghi TaxID=27349 RepID=A0A0L6VH57_9BASI|nr:hypothetical protein VP01_1609g10 [Puccinia sorghi]
MRKNMKVYNFFLTPAELEAFEDGVFSKEQNEGISCEKEHFINTLFDFDLFKLLFPQVENNIVEISNNKAERNLNNDSN